MGDDQPDHAVEPPKRSTNSLSPATNHSSSRGYWAGLLWATTNRITRSGQELGPEHALNVEEAIVAMTSDAAYQHFEENEKGSIAAGKLADLVVLSRDPREGATTELLDISIVGTMSHGEWVFGDLGADP